MATASAVEELLRSRFGANLPEDVVPVVMRQLDHLRMLISAIAYSSMTEVNDILALLYRELDRKLAAKNTNSWPTLETFICTIVESACSPVSRLFPRDIRQAIGEYYEGSYLASLSLFFDMYQGKVHDVSWKALGLMQEVIHVAQRTGFLDISSTTGIPAKSPSKSKSTSPSSTRSSVPLPTRHRKSVPPLSPRPPSGLAWFIHADQDSEREQLQPTNGRSSRSTDSRDAPLRREALSPSPSILPRTSTEQFRSLSGFSSDSDKSQSIPKSRQSGGARQPSVCESPKHQNASLNKIVSLIDQRSPSLTDLEIRTSPTLSPKVQSKKERTELGDSIAIGGSSVQDQRNLLSEFLTPPTRQDARGNDKPVITSRRTLNFDDDADSLEVLGGMNARPRSSLSSSSRSSVTSKVEQAVIEGGSTFNADSDQTERSRIRSRFSEVPNNHQSELLDSAGVNENRESYPEPTGLENGFHAEESLQASPSECITTSPSQSGGNIPDPDLLSSRLLQLEKELSDAKERGTEFSSKLKKAQETVSTFLEKGAETKDLFGQLEQESNNLMSEMERFQDQGDAFFQQFESVRQDVRKLQKSAEQISTLKGVLAQTRSELAREKEKTIRAERELAELREEMQINELTSQFDYMETSARQLESQANVMQILLQQTRRQLDAVRTDATEARLIESEIEKAIREHDQVVQDHQRTCQDLSQLRARLLGSKASVVDSSTQYEFEDGSAN